MEVWIMKDHNRKQISKRHSINIGVLTGKEPYVSLLTFCNIYVVMIGEYFPDVKFSTLKLETLMCYN